MSSLVLEKPRFRRYHALAICCFLLVCVIALVETLVPNQAGFIQTSFETNPLDSLPRYLSWKLPQKGGWAEYLFAYPVLLSAFALISILGFLWNLGNWKALEEHHNRLIGITKGGPSEADDTRARIRFLLRRRSTLIEPLIGGVFVSLICWLVAVVIAGKINPEWSAPFLSPPMLVAQNLQQLGADLLKGTLRSSWHLLQGVIWGTVLGVFLGFLLSHAKWLHQWTTWHLTVISAIPPLLLIEVFKQVARLPGFPAVGVRNEIAFKSAIAMACWAVTWPILTATAHALSRIDKEYRSSIRLLGARTPLEKLRHIELPIIIPPALANLRIGLVIGLILLIVGERQGGPSDLPTIGYLFGAYSEAYKLQSIMAFLVFTSALIIAFEAVLRMLETRFVLAKSREARISSSGVEMQARSVDDGRNFLEEFELRRAKEYPSSSLLGSLMKGPAISAVKLGKTYGESVALKAKGSVEINFGEFVSIIGRSGAGKSTFLKLLLGFEEPDPTSGSSLTLAGIDALGEGKSSNVADRIAYVAQRPYLLPDRTVESNIIFGLRQQWKHAQRGDLRLDEKSLRWLTDYMIWLCGSVDPLSWEWRRADSSPLGLLIRFMAIGDKMSNFPSELSGGEAQRVHLLRWLVLGRPIMFMDEAFSALDQPLKGMVRDAIQRHAKAFGMTIVNVSHDRADVLQVSDRVIFVNDGEIVDNASPKELYYSPGTLDLAVFLGHTNIFFCKLGGRDSREVLILEDAYRSRSFNCPVAVSLVEGLADLTSRDNQVEPPSSNDGQFAMFIPRSDINIVEISHRGGDCDLCEDLFCIDHLRFTGTHYDVRLSRAVGGQAFQIDSVIQDDDMQRLVELAGLAMDCVVGGEAKVSIRRGIVIQEIGQ